MNDRYWDQWLYVLIKMHEYECTTYHEFLGHVHDSWLDACTRVDHNRIVARLMGGW